MTTTRNTMNAAAALKTLRYGIEIETVGKTRNSTAKAVAAVFGGTVRHDGGYYDKYIAVMPDGREWTIMSDGSLHDDSGHNAEVVSPILTFADDRLLQDVVRALRSHGNRINETCGIHVHVDGARLDAEAACRLVRLVYRREAQILHALAVQQRRLGHYCKPVARDLVSRIDSVEPRTLSALNPVWYGRTVTSPAHYDDSRYHGLNLHSLWYRGTVEYRWFEASLHAGKVRAYTLFARALSAIAITGAQYTDEYDRNATEQDSFLAFLSTIGLGGEEFENYREHLADRCSTTRGSAAGTVRDYTLRPTYVAPTPIAVAPVARPVAAPVAATVRPAVAPARAAVAGEDPREPARGERLSHYVRGRGRVVITRGADGRYVVEQAIVAETVGRSYDSISAAASAATGTRVNGYRMFSLGERSRGEARA